MDVCFRVDAGPGIGAGHLMRCLALADELAARGARTAFICRAVWADEADAVVARKHSLFRLPAGPVADDAQQTLDTLSARALEPDWIVVDHYRLSREWERCLAPRTRRMLVIDDLADRAHDADLLLDPTYGETGARYRALVPSSCRCLCGSSYALLRPQFRQQRQAPEHRLPPVEQLTVHAFFGSFDADNHTERFSRLLLQGVGGVRVRAAVGLAYAYSEQLQQLVFEFGQRFSWAAGVEDMAAHMAGCDVALGAPGGASWERACVGLPAAYLAVTANQIAIVERLRDRGLCAYFGAADSIDDSAFVDNMRCFLADAPALHAMRTLGMNAVDGRGAQRVAEILEELL